jgi:hypothetical protein
MIEQCNKPEKSDTRNKAYYDRCSTSGRGKLEEFIIKSTQEGKPFIVRRFGRPPGGIGKTATTRTIDGFLEHRNHMGGATTTVQPQGQPQVTVDTTELRQEFQKTPTLRTYLADELAFSLWHECIRTSYDIEFPVCLRDSDILSLAIDVVQMVDPLALADIGTAVVSMEGSFASFRQTELAIYAVMSVGSKVWALLPNSSHNKQVMKDWKESDGLGCFEKVVVVDTHPGDLIMIPSGWHYAVYSVHDSLTLGGYYIVPESLVSTLEVATEQKKSNPSDDDGRLDRIGEYLKALISVQVF